MRQLWTILLLAGLTGLAAAFPVQEMNTVSSVEGEDPDKCPMEEKEPEKSPMKEEEPEKSPMMGQGPGETFIDLDLSEVDPTLLVELATKLQEIEEAESKNEGVLALLTDVLDKLLNALSTNLIGWALGIGKLL